MPTDRTVTLRGQRFHYVEWGTSADPPIVALHGITGHARTWDDEAGLLAATRRVLVLDQRGHGDSDPAPDGDYSDEALLGDLVAFVEALGLRRCSLLGLSLGGRVAINFAGRHPARVERLVVVDIGPEISARASAPSSGPPEPETWESIEQAAQHLYRGNPFPGIHYYRWVASHSLRQQPDGALVWKWHPSVKTRRSTGDVDWWALLRTIVPPTLVLRGEHSTVLDRDVAERMAKELPQGRLVEIPRAVHTLHEDNPEAVVAALREFLGF